MAIKYSNKKVIEVQDWDQLVTQTYGKPYNFQQQDGCQDRGTFDITIPSEDTNDDNMHNSIPEVVNGRIMGVKFDVWLDRDPRLWKGLLSRKVDFEVDLFWRRNFYPDIQMVANDLCDKGLIEPGDYTINIDW